MDDVFIINKESSIKRKSLTLKDRLRILDRLEAGFQVTQLADEYAVAKSTISNIKKAKDNILKRKKTIESCGGDFTKRRFKGTEESALETALFEWYCEQKKLGDPPTGPMLREKALYFYKIVGGPEKFKASTGWLSLFKKRHGIRFSTAAVDPLPEDAEAAEEFQKKFINLINVTEINLDYLYNCTETRLFWRMLPSKSLIRKRDKYAVDKENPSDIVTVMLCSNHSGNHKVPLYINEKSDKAHCTTDINKLPVIYENQDSTWTESSKTLVMEWYQNVFIPEVKKQHNCDNNTDVRIILLMDSNPHYPSEEEFNSVTDLCTVILLPPNTAPLIQPLSQGIVGAFKKIYKTLLLKRVIAEGSVKGTDKILQLLNMLDCCTYCELAWKEMTETSIRKSWKRLMTLKYEPKNVKAESIETFNIHYLISQIPEYRSMSIKDTNRWLQADSNKYVVQSSDKNEKERGRNQNKNSENDDDNDDDDDDDDAEEESNECREALISAREAFEGLSTFINWVRTNDHSSSSVNLVMLEQLRQYVVEKLIHEK